MEWADTTPGEAHPLPEGGKVWARSQKYCGPIRLLERTTHSYQPHLAKAGLHNVTIEVWSIGLLEAVRNSSNKLSFEETTQQVIYFMTDNDVFAVLPTRFDKSLCYCCLVLLTFCLDVYCHLCAGPPLQRLQKIK